MHKKFTLGLAVVGLLLGVAHVASARDPLPLIVVDKAKNQIHLAHYNQAQIQIQKSFHVTLGKVKGDKEVEKDLKTPEGFYYFTAKLTAPNLKKKFGAMAFMTNYPNPIDQLAGKTGYDIMLHSTDDPPRLARDLDSEGCVVVNDAQITELSQSIRLGLTPLVIYSELKPEYLNAQSNAQLVNDFQSWLQAWNGKDIENYIQGYAENFVFNGMNLKKYKEYKDSLNRKYSEIKVGADNLRFFQHPKYQVVSFTQRYESKMKGGSKGFKSSGTKTLYFVQQGSRYKIVNESYSNLKED